MRKTAILAFALALLPSLAVAQSAPATMGYHTVYGRLGAAPGDTGPGQAIPFATLGIQLLGGAQAANLVYAGPASGGSATPGFRALVAADMGAMLSAVSTWTGAQSFSDGKLILLGLTSGSSTLKAPATGGGTATLFPGTDTIAGLAAAQTLLNKTLTVPFISTILGGSAAGSSVTLQSTNNGSPSGDVANIYGTIINLRTVLSTGTTTVNIGSANSTNGVLTLAGVTSGAVTVQSTATASGTLTLPNGADTLVARTSTDTLTNKTINGGSNTFCQPSRSVFTTGTNATYTTPTCNSVQATRIEFEMVGGGGGGAGSGTTPGAATGGGATCFHTSSPACTTPLYQGGGGGLGSTSASSNATGGAAAGCDLNLTGGMGGPANNVVSNQGGPGGASFFGGQGLAIGLGVATGGAAAANTGSGGSGADDGSTVNSGGGGGAGGYCRKMITAPASSYFYTIGAAGAAGTAGTSGFAGGAGAAGLIIVTAYWQ